MPAEEAALKALRKFAASVNRKMSALSAGEPEDQLRRPFEVLVEEIGEAISIGVVCKGESPLPGRHGKPDYAIHARGLLAGFAELKAPGKGADPRSFRGHDKKQWKRFKDQPNLLYCDGNEWALYRRGERVRPLLRLDGDICIEGKQAVRQEHGEALTAILRDFLEWEPEYPADAKQLAELLAPLCRLLREDVLDALRAQAPALVRLAQDWREMLFPLADDPRFADAYAQTVTFALLLARSEGAVTLDLHNAVAHLASGHSLLSRALLVLTDRKVRDEISASVSLLQRVINSIPPAAFARKEKDPWLFFYEPFLAAYDPKLRKNAGVYYTPVEVAQAQVRLVDELLTGKLKKRLGFADPDVVTLDPAAGTGTYLISVIVHGLEQVERRQGKGAVPGKATELAGNLHGFEIMVGPFAVSELRVTRALLDRGATLPKEGVGIYLTDTLESPNAEPALLPQFLAPLAEQHRRALHVKDEVPVIVCLGNPPYDRHEAADPSDERTYARTGGWVRWGDVGDPDKAILRHFIQPAIEAGHGGDVKNLYNLYVYFWRWALWKVFEQKGARGPGVVSFISASSYLTGHAFAGMREHMREICDEIWIVDLGGEGRGARQSDNVFDIKTPVAIAIAVCYDRPNRRRPACVHYARVEGSRSQKLAQLAAIHSRDDVRWRDCPSDWQALFRPPGEGTYFQWPLLTDLFPWQHSGAQMKRTWPIAPDEQTLGRRWTALLSAEDRAEFFKETRDGKITRTYLPLLPPYGRAEPIAELPKNAPMPRTSRYGFRSFDRQWVIADTRVGDFMRPVYWQAQGSRQVYFASLLSEPLGGGPALTASAAVPDLHYFSGRGAKDTVPLYRDKDGRHPNTPEAVLSALSEKLNLSVTPEDLAAYVYGALAHPAFVDRFRSELGKVELRVPIIKDPKLFEQVTEVGRRLLWLHTYGDRFVPRGETPGRIPDGKAMCTKAVPDDPDRYPDEFGYDETTETLRVGRGEFHPVDKAVWEFQVSGLEIVKSWLRYRMKHGYGRKSSPLDDIRPERWTAQFTTELLELLWVLEHTLAIYPKQAELLDAVLDGPLFQADDFPPVPDEMRKPPKPRKDRKQQRMWDED